MDISARTMVEKRLVALRIVMRELGVYGRGEDFYIDGFRRIEKLARNAADTLEADKIQLRLELDLQ
jgi:hypothetical protein